MKDAAWLAALGIALAQTDKANQPGNHPMQPMDIFAQTGGFQSMARELGVSEGEVQSGAAELLPAILGGFKKQAQSNPAGVEGLGGLLGQLGGGGLLDNVLSPQPTDIGRGNGVLGQIFGSKDASRAVAESAASRTNLDASLMKRMLPMLAMMVAGYMAKQRGGGVGTMGGFGGLGALLGGGDGNPLDDILGMARRRH
jgi:hypothetical protein